jgi:phospholipase/lecithinase/hemolysin
VPRVRVLSPTGACADGMNKIAAGFDGALKALLAGLKLQGLRYSIADSYGQATTADPAALGFVSAVSACCGGGRLGAEAECTPNSTLCANRDGYLFWDSVHPSQRAAMISAQTFYNGPSQFTAPVTFKQLATA